MVPREPTAHRIDAQGRIENYEAWPGQTADLWVPNSIGTRGLRSNLRPDSESARKIALERLSVNTPWENKNKNCSDTGDPYSSRPNDRRGPGLANLYGVCVP